MVQFLGPVETRHNFERELKQTACKGEYEGRVSMYYRGIEYYKHFICGNVTQTSQSSNNKNGRSAPKKFTFVKLFVTRNMCSVNDSQYVMNDILLSHDQLSRCPSSTKGNEMFATSCRKKVIFRQIRCNSLVRVTYSPE